ncbi:unnamed protein product, partial [Rotaria sp. Silwood1]
AHIRILPDIVLRIIANP